MNDAESLTVSQRAYRALERMIVTLELRPGALTTERELLAATRLGRTPVREAVQRLSWEGLIEIRPRAGLEIARLDPRDWLRVLDARTGVELVLARSAAKARLPEAETQFHGAAMAMQKAVMEKDVVAFLDADKAWDEAMAQAADNPFAVRVAAPLQTHSRRFWYQFRRGQGLAESAAQHVEIIRAVIARDALKAEGETAKLMALLRHHALTVAGDR